MRDVRKYGLERPARAIDNNTDGKAARGTDVCILRYVRGTARLSQKGGCWADNSALLLLCFQAKVQRVPPQQP